MNDTTTTVRVRFASVADVRSWFTNHYYGMAPDELNIAKTCRNHGIEYQPPRPRLDVTRYPAPEFEQFWMESDSAICTRGAEA